MQKGSKVQTADAVQTLLGDTMLVLLLQTIVRDLRFLRQGFDYNLHNLEGVENSVLLNSCFNDPTWVVYELGSSF